MKELELLKERVQQASRLLPWWANLILAEVSFVTLYLLESGLLWMVLVSSFFVAASIVANFETERREHKIRRREAEEERMPVTKIIVKDLMKEKYRESFIKAQKEPEQLYSENYSKTMIIGVIAATMIISTAIMIKIGGKLLGEKEKLAISPVPKSEPERHIPIQSRPMIAAKQKTQAAFKVSPKGEKILSYRVSMQDGRDLDCKDVDRTAEEMFLFKCENLSGAVHISRIKDMEMRTEIPNGSRVTVIQPQKFPF